jgi:tetratricopeptide (TPR) repeat protein
LRTLAQTGLVGGLLALVGLTAALWAAMQAVRSDDPLGRYVAAAALAGFGYWVVHGSVDWFWEFAGLGAPAWALLGLSCALEPRQRQRQRQRQAQALAVPAPRRQLAPARSRLVSSRSQVAVLLLGAAGALLVAASLAAPWLSQLEVQSAARVWPTAPGKAYARLNDAAGLNPLSDAPYVVAGSIALRLGEVNRADHEFALALQRVPGDAYATLERGAIASSAGRRAQALVLLERAAQLNPRDALAQQALALARRGQRVDVGELNRSILHEAQQLS